MKLKVTNHIWQERLQATVQEGKNIMVIISIKPFVQYIFMHSFQISYQEHHWTTAHDVVFRQISYQYIENISKTKVIQ